MKVRIKSLIRSRNRRAAIRGRREFETHPRATPDMIVEGYLISGIYGTLCYYKDRYYRV